MEKSEVISLIPRCQAGDPEAQEQLVLAIQDRVFYHCKKMLRNEDDALDATQEILIAVLTKLGTLKEPAAFWGWLSAATANYCRNALRKGGREVQIPEDEEGNSLLDTFEDLDEQAVPDKALDTQESRRMILELIDGLPDAQRLCVLMYYYDEMGVRDIAAALEVSEGTVKSRLNYARKAIKEGVDRYAAQGVKLYGLAPLPFLVYILQQDAMLGGLTAAQSGVCVQAALTGSSAALAGTAAGAAAGTTSGAAGAVAAEAATAGAAAGSAASGAAGHGLAALLLAHKGAAAAVAAVVLAGSVGTAALLSQPEEPPAEPAPPPVVEVIDPIPDPEPEPVIKPEPEPEPVVEPEPIPVPEPEPVSASGISFFQQGIVTEPDIFFYRLDVYDLSPEALDTETPIPSEEISFTSESPNLIAISSMDDNSGNTYAGFVGLGREGTGYITATWNGQTARCRVDLVNLGDGISLTPLGAVRCPGERSLVTLLDGSFASDFGEEYTVEWTVSDPAVIRLEPVETPDDFAYLGEHSAQLTFLDYGVASVTCRVTWLDGTVRQAYSSYIVHM